MMRSFPSNLLPHRLRLTFLLFCSFLMQACTPVPPETVVGEFWAAALVGDKQAVAALALPSNFDTEHFETARYQELFNHAVVGEVNPGSRQARIATRLEGHFQDIEFDTITVLYQRSWRVDYVATTNEMIAALLSKSADDINTDIVEDIKALDKGMGESIREEWRSLDRRLNSD